MTSDVISRIIVFRDQVGDAVPVRLVYDKLSPWEIKLIFMNDITWVFGRDLLFEGLREQSAGDGDVHVSAGLMYAYIDLYSPEGNMGLRGSLSAVKNFARETHKLVPQGEEYMEINDTDLLNILEGH